MKCPICNSIEVDTIFRELNKCPHCGFVWADIDLNQKKLDEI